MAKKNNRNKQVKNKTEVKKTLDTSLESQKTNPKEHLEDLSNNIDIKSVSIQESKNENIQENNENIIPSSSREEVEVDKIFKLLQEAKDELKNKNNFQKDRNERINKIIDDIPTQTMEEKESLSVDSVQFEEDTREEEIKTDVDEESSEIKEELPPKKDSHIISYLLVLIIFILVYLLLDNNNTIKLNANTQTLKQDLRFTDLTQELQNEYISRTAVNQSQEQTKELMEKSKLLIEQNKMLEDKIQSLNKEKLSKIDASKEEKVKNNRNLLKEISALKNEQNIYSGKVVALKISNKKNINKMDLLKEKNEVLEEAIIKLKENNQVPSKVTTATPSESQEDRYKKIVDKEVFPAVKSTSKDYKILKCYDLNPGQFYLSSKCKKDISQFVKINKKALRFEVIGVVDQKDFSSLYTQDTKSKNALELQKYNTMGLARYRVLETSWFLNEQLKDVVLTPVNYTLTSKKTNRGSIIRAYYK